MGDIDLQRLDPSRVVPEDIIQCEEDEDEEEEEGRGPGKAREQKQLGESMDIDTGWRLM